MKVKQFLLDALHAEGISYAFLVPGGLIDPLLEALATNVHIKPIIACHEGGAAYMADGYSRASGHFGACFCIGGPGITNTATALAAARSDESPVIVISGEVSTLLEGRGTFQDSGMDTALNDLRVIQGLTAQQFTILDAQMTPVFLRKLLAKMVTPPCAPVHLVVPVNIQETEVDAPYQPITQAINRPDMLDHQASARCWDYLRGKKNIVIYAGEGVEKADASASLIEFAERFQIPVTTTLRAKGVFPEDHPLSLGIFGYSGTRQAIETLLSDQVEILLVLGSGLNQRDTLFWNTKLKPSSALIQVDVNPEVIGDTYQTQLPIVGDCGEFLRYLLQSPPEKLALLEETKSDRQKWLTQIRALPRFYDEENCKSDAIPIHPARVIADLRKVMPRDTIVLVDSGAHRAFAGHYWQSYAPRQYISATNLGPMGWAIPAGIGVKLAQPEHPCVVITGDGCMLMHGIEIQTAARYGVSVIYVVINNSALGNVYLRAKKVGPQAAALTELPTHDWVAFAKSLGADGIRVDKPQTLETAFEQALKMKGPVLIDIHCGRDYTTPVAPFAKSQHEWHE
ncbi:thiamine pyrophosphate-binding protein [Aquicella lusitana]|uniref:Acetolactate synthase-1/2/3 large subunit n=1 Tax=Aquicella lusitana TaxID=254246 RepID=A0A370G0K6_9COXI|nr:thiamine pyrophosphate-binding protein [Aquicella lusitana]RDI37275.1 acetolactate synthase-1/2/3 large subunit [Aquicella lusitana]VVC73644.1 Acetolactate synthase large subunit [Aquicella lusitana]